MSILKVEIQQLYKNTKQYAEQRICVYGWARQLRIQKRFGFIQLNDGSYFNNLQVVVENEKVSNYDEIRSQHIGAAFKIVGKFILTPDARQAFELNAETVEVVGNSGADFPLQKKSHTPEFLRSIAHLRTRSNLFSAVFKIRSEAAFAIHQFFHSHNFMYVHTPIINESDAEGAGEMFRVTTIDLKEPPLDDNNNVDYSRDFFNKSTFLTVSGQLNAESFAQAYGKVYTFGPTFRAENSNTSRHAAEFWMIEPEIAFADLSDVMYYAEAMIKFIFKHILDNCKPELNYLEENEDSNLISRLESVANSEFKRVTYTEAVEILKTSNVEFNFPVDWGMDLQTEHERYLTEQYFKGPLFVTDYPKDIKAFYMRVNDDNKTVAAVDCLVPGIGEIIGGSQREERLNVLTQEMKRRSMNPDLYDWYIDLRRYGTTPHGGYGLGFERLIMYLTGVSNIRDVLPFPRTTGNADF